MVSERLALARGWDFFSLPDISRFPKTSLIIILGTRYVKVINFFCLISKIGRLILEILFIGCAKGFYHTC